MVSSHCPRCGGACTPPGMSSAGQAICSHCGQPFSANARPELRAPAEPAALLLQCLGQSLVKGAVTALGAALASGSGQDVTLPEVEPDPFRSTASPANGNTVSPDPGRVVDAVFAAPGENGLPDAAGRLAELPGASGGEGQRRAEVALGAGLTAALQELQRGGLADLVRALRARSTGETPPD